MQLVSKDRTGCPKLTWRSWGGPSKSEGQQAQDKWDLQTWESWTEVDPSLSQMGSGDEEGGWSAPRGRGLRTLSERDRQTDQR